METWNRRLLLVGATKLLFMSGLTAAEASDPLFEAMASKARAVAEIPYNPPDKDLPDVLDELDYSDYRDIRFRNSSAIWRGASPFEMQLFHLGFIYREPVSIFLVDETGNRKRLNYDNRLFEYGERVNTRLAELKPDLAFAGFRLHYNLNSQNYKDELIVFQGASYFRLVGPGQVYGLSARGLAINTGEPQGEEFPRFSEFWVQKAESDTNHINIYALLESPSITGAYHFQIKPAAQTYMDTRLQLFARKDIAKVGIAPLTSMFFYGENSPYKPDDFRPEVHDSDGLAVLTADNLKLWRVLNNPRHLQITSSVISAPKGFGLIQRDREFQHYQDSEAHYHKRPSYWVEPRGDWGSGRVELVELPTPDETNDNIVAYWVSDQPVRAGEMREYRYRLTSLYDELPGKAVARVIQTRQGWAAIPGQSNPPPINHRQFVVDFAGGDLVHLPADAQVKVQTDVSRATLRDTQLKRLSDGHTWRVSFKLQPNDGETADIRLKLTYQGTILSEEWNYVFDARNLR